MTIARTVKALLAFSFLLLAPAGQATDPIPELAPLVPFTGKTWRAVGNDDGFEDVARWEWILKGRVMRITHVVGDGAYAGESVIHWDDVQEKIIYRYVTTAGFYTDGVITPVDGGFDVHEYVRGAKSGPTETLSGYRIKDGQMHTWAKLLTDGKWSEVSEYVYEEAPGIEVILPE